MTATEGEAPLRASRGARIVAAVLFALAAAAAAYGAVLSGEANGALDLAALWAALSGEAGFGALSDGPSWRHVREAAPLAGLLGAVIGYVSVDRWPASFVEALAVALISLIVTVIFFVMAYVLGEALISAFLGQPAGDAVTSATQRLGERLPAAIALGAAGFAASALVLWLAGQIARRLSR